MEHAQPWLARRSSKWWRRWRFDVRLLSVNRVPNVTKGTHVALRFRGPSWTYSATFVWRSLRFFPHNLTLLRISWSFLDILIVGALQIGRPAQQCAGRSLVKVGETYVARG